MIRNRKQTDAALRFTERRRREDEAPRLLREIPELTGLHFEVEELRAGTHSVESRHVRRIVLQSAPALFLMSCSNPDCKAGGHDVTFMVMRALRERLAEFRGEDVCTGEVGTGECGSILRFVAHASYQARKG